MNFMALWLQTKVDPNRVALKPRTFLIAPSSFYKRTYALRQEWVQAPPPNLDAPTIFKDHPNFGVESFWHSVEGSIQSSFSQPSFLK